MRMRTTPAREPVTHQNSSGLNQSVHSTQSLMGKYCKSLTNIYYIIYILPLVEVVEVLEVVVVEMEVVVVVVDVVDDCVVI